MVQLLLERKAFSSCNSGGGRSMEEERSLQRLLICPGPKGGAASEAPVPGKGQTESCLHQLHTLDTGGPRPHVKECLSCHFRNRRDNAFLHSTSFCRYKEKEEFAEESQEQGASFMAYTKSPNKHRKATGRRTTKSHRLPALQDFP